MNPENSPSDPTPPESTVPLRSSSDLSSNDSRDELHSFQDSPRASIAGLPDSRFHSMANTAAFAEPQSNGLISEQFSPLDPRMVQADILTGLITWAIVSLGISIGVGIAWWNLGLTLLFYGCVALGVISIIAFLVLSLVWPGLEFKRTSYRIDNEGMEIRRGVIWRHFITIPLGRVQHADVSQGPIQRVFGIGTLTVHTAGTKNASIELSGLEYNRAVAIRDLIVHQRKEQDAV